MEHEILICKCESPEHQFIFSYFPEDKDGREVYVSIHLRSESNIFKRIWEAIKYIFGYKSIYGNFDEFIMRQSDSRKLVKILKYLDPDVLKNFSQESKNNTNP